MEGGQARDLIGDIHAQHRRRVLKRAALLAALAVVLLLVGLAFKLVADRTSRDRTLEAARAKFALGAPVDVEEAVGILEEGLTSFPDDPVLGSALALARAHSALELGEGLDAAKAAFTPVAEVDAADAALARGLLALAEGDHDAALAACEQARALGGPSLAPEHARWLEGMIALSRPEPEALRSAADGVGAVVDADGSLVAYRRLMVGLHMGLGETERALEELGRAREQSFAHKGLAADEALYNAIARQRLGGVASVSEQLLSDPEGLSSRDRSHARLARALVHVQSGEASAGLSLLEQAWAELPRWDAVSRALALELAMEAHAGDRALEWAESAGLPAEELALYSAWAQLSGGDLMGALAALADLPQENPRVAYLQGLALVEQGRWAEALPWVERAATLVPGRVELEVARARAELHTGKGEAALRKLKGLAEEEPHAPRAWTGLGEAYMQVEGQRDPEAARQAFERAIEREHAPAEAMLRLAELWNARRERDPEAVPKARALFERAAATNPKLPRYRERLAAYLAEIGHPTAAIELLRALVDEEGIAPTTPLALCRFETESAGEGDGRRVDGLDAWLARAEALGAAAPLVERERLRATVFAGAREELEPAHAALAAVLEEHGADTDARVLYARSLLRMFDRDKAEAAIRRGLQVSPESEHGLLYLEWARMEARSGNRRKGSVHARVAWLKLLAADAEPAALLDALDVAVALFLRDRKPKPAVAVARTATDRMPWHARAWMSRARAELSANEAKEGVASAEKAVELGPEDPTAHALLGDAVMRFGLKDRARDAYRKAIELARSPGEAGEYKDKLSKL
jgi:tetratricopeptide (TPR) repeat protein